jgi:hypothetical protein
VLWNAYKKMTANCTSDERDYLFCRTAVDTYRLDI